MPGRLAAKSSARASSKPASKWDRSNSYREDFLRYNKGIFGCLYFCAYCGRPITKKRMQVDHHIAINYVKKNPIFKLYFGISNAVSNVLGKILHGSKWKKNTGVNVSYNLIPACPKCNNAKKDKGGLWIIRGMIGGTVWKVVNFVNNIVLALFKPPFGSIILVGGVAAPLIFTPLGASLVALFA